MKCNHLKLARMGGEPAKNLKYKITVTDGQVFEGVSDEDGKTKYVIKML